MTSPIPADIAARLEALERFLAGDYAYNHAETCRSAIDALASQQAEIDQLRGMLAEAKSRFVKIENIISRNLFHQQEKIADAKSIATDGWCELDRALNTLENPNADPV